MGVRECVEGEGEGIYACLILRCCCSLSVSLPTCPFCSGIDRKHADLFMGQCLKQTGVG